MRRETAFLMILVVAACTLFTRMLPFVLFGGKRKVPERIRYLGNVLPAAIMAVLVVYCLKGVNLFAGSHGLPELVSTAATALLHLWKRNILLSIAAGTFCYMFLVQAVF